MTTVPSSTDTNSTSNTNNPSKVLSSLTSNFDTFLTMLTAQLTNQDPTNPMDTTAFTQQITQFCGVEAQIETNSKLDSLIAQSASNTNTYAVSYLGKKVVMSDGTGVLSGGTVTWKYGLGAAGDTTNLTVTDANGNTVYTKDGETGTGNHDFTWDGKKADGTQLADGVYKLTVTTKTADGTKVTTSVASAGTVSGIDFSGTTPKLIIGTSEIDLSDVAMLSN
jgi:flagellar basal-body rod modification protein FlgD